MKKASKALLIIGGIAAILISISIVITILISTLVVTFSSLTLGFAGATSGLGFIVWIVSAIITNSLDFKTILLIVLAVGSFPLCLLIIAVLTPIARIPQAIAYFVCTLTSISCGIFSIVSSVKENKKLLKTSLVLLIINQFLLLILITFPIIFGFLNFLLSLFFSIIPGLSGLFFFLLLLGPLSIFVLPGLLLPFVPVLLTVIVNILILVLILVNLITTLIGIVTANKSLKKIEQPEVVEIQ